MTKFSKTINDVKSVESEPPKESKKSYKKLLLPAVLGLIILVLALVAGYFYMQYQDVKKDPETAKIEKNKAETQRVMDKLKASILITDKDSPTVARVEDPEKLKSSNQEFYKDIQKGDYLIIYPKRAIVYRETNDQIINIAPIINTADLQKKQQETLGTTEPANNTLTE